MSAETPEQARFKAALASWASGVAVVSTEGANGPEGTTVSSFTSLSLDPPLVLICLAPSARVVEPLRARGRFALTILAADQVEASRHFAQKGREKGTGFGAIPVARTPDALPMVEGGAAWMSCALFALIPQGDHHIVVGRVEHAGADESRPPLLYFRRGYRALEARAP